MIDAADITVAAWDQLHADIAVGNERRIHEAKGRVFQSENRLVEFREHIVLMTDNGAVIDLSEHSILRLRYEFLSAVTPWRGARCPAPRRHPMLLRVRWTAA